MRVCLFAKESKGMHCLKYSRRSEQHTLNTQHTTHSTRAYLFAFERDVYRFCGRDERVNSVLALKENETKAAGAPRVAVVLDGDIVHCAVP